MLVYALAAVFLGMALLLLSMALAHKTLLNEDMTALMTARLDRLSEQTASRWGRMNVAQMLHHVAAALRMATGDLVVPPRQTFLRRFPVKQLIVFVLPFPKGAPTAPALVATSTECDFALEQKDVRGLLQSFAKREIAQWPEHPAFGPLTRDQWGVLVWKHVDHHFRQFSV